MAATRETGVGVGSLGTGFLGSLGRVVLALPVDPGGRAACLVPGSMPSHHTSPSSVGATLVKIYPSGLAMQLGVGQRVRAGATPKVAGLGIDGVHLAVSMGLDPGNVVANGGDLPASKNRPQAAPASKVGLAAGAGKTASHWWYFACPGVGAPRISMCSASQPWSRPMVENAQGEHFLPSRARCRHVSHRFSDLARFGVVRVLGGGVAGAFVLPHHQPAASGYAGVHAGHRLAVTPARYTAPYVRSSGAGSRT